MKAFLLAAGQGKRLGNLTQNCPKCVLPIAGKSMIEHWYYIFKMYNVTDVLINTHYLANKVMEHCSKLVDYGIKTTFTYEKELLGTAKTIASNRDFVKDESHFLIVYADTWMQIDLKNMLRFQKKRKGLGTLGLYKPSNLKDQGAVEVSERKILTIEEKSQSPKGKHAFAGIMIGSRPMFKFYNETMTD